MTMVIRMVAEELSDAPVDNNRVIPEMTELSCGDSQFPFAVV
jgi:hypothetical protein